MGRNQPQIRSNLSLCATVENSDIMFQMVVASMEVGGHRMEEARPIMIVYKNSMPTKVEAEASVPAV